MTAPAAGIADPDESLLELLYGTPVGIVGFRDDGHIDFINPLACNLILPTLAQPVIENIYDCLAPGFPNLRQKIAASGRPASSRPGSVIVDRTTASILVGSAVRFYSLFVSRIKRGVNIAVIEDVTEAERVNERLRHTQRLESLGRLTAEIAHRFNNTLQGIATSTAVIGRQPGLTGVARECVATIRKAVDHGAGLVRRLLGFSGKRALAPQLHKVETVHADLLQRIGKDRRRTLSVRIDDSAAKAEILADRTELVSSLVNLVLNARDAMPDGGTITLRADRPSAVECLRAGLEGTAYVRLVVADTGIGMTDAARARAFEPFFTTKEPGQGAGIGLASVYGFAKQSGGTAQIDSARGYGTTVTLWLPIAET